jgi:uncharacterized protein (TIGR02147 family)
MSWNAFDHLHYRPLVRAQCLDWKKEKPGWTLHRIALKSKIQSPHLTNVLKEKAHLSSDQLHSLSLLFVWNPEETEYAHLLLERERSSLAARKTTLTSRIEEMRQKKLQPKANLKKEIIGSPGLESEQRYFLNPHYSLINGFLGIPEFSRSPKKIAAALHLSEKKVLKMLKELEEMKLVIRESGAYQRVRTNFHLPQESPFCEPYMKLMQSIANHQIGQLAEEEKHNFNVVFSADAKTKDQIQAEFMRFLKAVEAIVKEAPPKSLYGMRFDLFAWGLESGGS